MAHAKNNETNEYVAYITERIQAQLEGYALGAEVSYSVLAERVGRFLLGSSVRDLLGATNSVSQPVSRNPQNG